MNSIENNINSYNFTSQPLFGLFELDANGKVLYSKVESDEIANRLNNGLNGLNFYDEVAGFKNINEFRQHLDQFTHCGSSVENFKFTCRFDDGIQEVKVRLVRVGEREYDGHAKLTIVDIRKI